MFISEQKPSGGIKSPIGGAQRPWGIKSPIGGAQRPSWGSGGGWGIKSPSGGLRGVTTGRPMGGILFNAK